MSDRIALVLLGILVGTFFLLRHKGSVGVHYGTQIADVGSGDTVTGTLLISPYGVEDKIIDIVSETQYEIDMWMYQLTSKEMLQVFRNLATLGVDIDIVLENNTYGGSTKERDRVQKQLGSKGIEIVSDEALGTNYVHAKTLLLDDHTYIISTANLGYSGFRRNREYRFIGQQKDIAESLGVLFDKDMAGERILHDDIHPSLLFCPVNCRQKLTTLLYSATETIDIQAQYIQDEEVVRILEQKQNDGVRVRLIVGAYQDDGWLDVFGTGVQGIEDVYVHSKNILIDNEILLLGSMNLSTNAIDNNREISIIIDDTKSVASFARQFEKDWK